MKSRLPLFLLLGVFGLACSGGESNESGAMEEEAPEAAAMAESDADAVAAIEEIRAGYVQHYNLHHPSMVADYYADDATSILANGSVSDGKAAIEGNLEAAMAANPTLDLEGHDQMVFGDRAVSWGTYNVDMAPEGGEASSSSGYYMSVFRNVDGMWKLQFVMTNYDAPPPEGAEMVPPPEDGPPPDLENSPDAALTAAWQQHYNLGHASMVADLHTDDGVTMWADSPVAEGREAIEAALAAGMAEGSPQIAIHEVMNQDLGDGYSVDAGWYQITVTGPEGEEEGPAGTWMTLVRTGADGQRRIHWALSNAPW